MDLLERLRRSVTEGWHPTDDDALDAADEIERLRAEIEKLRGHKEEADRHIATIARLRHDLAAERERCQEIWTEAIDKSVAEAIAAERERCARVCDKLAATVLEKVTGREHQVWAYNRAAAAIRKGE